MVQIKFFSAGAIIKLKNNFFFKEREQDEEEVENKDYN